MNISTSLSCFTGGLVVLTSLMEILTLQQSDSCCPDVPLSSFSIMTNKGKNTT